MTETVSAVYENGVLRPKQPLALTEGAEVEIVIVPRSPAAAQRTLAEIMREIAALPVQGGGDPYTSRDHDKYLYGSKDQP